MVQHIEINKCDTHVKKIKDKNHMTISIDAGEKSIWKNLTFFHEKSTQQIRYKGNAFNTILYGFYYDKPVANIILNTEKLKAFPLRSGCPLSPLLFNRVLEVPARVIKKKKERKGILIGKEEVKLCLFLDKVILYTENPKESTKKKKTELINKFNKVVGCKTNIQSCFYIRIPNYSNFLY